MKNFFSFIVGAIIVVVACGYLFNHLPGIKPAQAEQPVEAGTEAVTGQPQESADAEKMVTVVGPLADYAKGEQASSDGSTRESNAKRNWKAAPSDIVGDSPTGTGGVVLHRTFSLETSARFGFVIPAHATNPQLHGNYHSFVREEGADATDENANVEFLLMNQQQYAAFAHGQQADIIFFVQSSHSQQVNFTLSPTYDKTAQYYLVFRNRSGAAKKVVQAEFSVDY